MRTETLVGILVAVIAARGAMADPPILQLAQWTGVTKQKPTPAPRQTPAGDREQRRQGAQQRPQSPFGAIRK